MAGGAAIAIGAGARAQTPTLTKVILSQALLIANYTPVYLAQQRGLFAKHGLDLDISTAGGIAVVLPVLLSSRAQFALSGSAPAVNATLEGGPMKCIANIAGGTALLVLARPGTVVNSLNDFKGKTIATLHFPSNTNVTPKYVFSKLGGFDPAAAGTKLLEFPPGAQAQAVKDGRADSGRGVRVGCQHRRHPIRAGGRLFSSAPAQSGPTRRPPSSPPTITSPPTPTRRNAW